MSFWEKPVPWKTMLAYPFLWIVGWFLELLESSLYDWDEPATPLSVLEPERPKGTFRLWDKDFNLLATWQEGDDLFLTRDSNGQRWSGKVTKFEAAAP